jgi:hypothetical protein
MAQRKPKSPKRTRRITTKKTAVQTKALAGAAEVAVEAAPEAAGGPTTEADDTWLTCVKYKLDVTRTDTFLFRFSAWDENGQEHGLDLGGTADRPTLAQDLFDALQIWPSVTIQFKSKAKPGAANPVITDVKRVHPRP